jgi:hypothetical protein
LASGLRQMVRSEGELRLVQFDQVLGLTAGAGDVLFANQPEQFVALASRHAVPAIYAWRDAAAAGGLISYGLNNFAIFRQVGIHTGKIATAPSRRICRSSSRPNSSWSSI